MSLLVKYVITDPCYILNNDTWDECCKFLDDSPKAFNEAVSKALTDLTGFPAYVCDTGFGDWNNKIYGSYIIHKEFCADSGKRLKISSDIVFKLFFIFFSSL